MTQKLGNRSTYLFFSGPRWVRDDYQRWHTSFIYLCFNNDIYFGNSIQNHTRILRLIHNTLTGITLDQCYHHFIKDINISSYAFRRGDVGSLIFVYILMSKQHNTMKLFFEALLVGIGLTILGIFIYWVVDHLVECSSSYVKLTFTLFIAGIVVHLLCEVSKINAWYCTHGRACT